MNDVVVKLSTQAEGNATTQSPLDMFLRSGYHTQAESSLKHASEKAIESYYHLFHLLLCIACEDKTIVPAVNRTLTLFLQGHNDKDAVPNLGHLLIMVLISDFDMDNTLTMAIIKEAVTRNVVWMLDTKGAGMAELSYMEVDKISEYRLKKTFEAGKTSYRLLMFFNLFRNTVNRGTGAKRKTVEQLRDEIFDAHGAPPRGAATQLAQAVKQLQQINDFPNFLQTMGITPPMASKFTRFLRDCCEGSVSKGYSVWAYTQEQALNLRQAWDKEPGVGVRGRNLQKPEWRRSASGTGMSFFPNNKGGLGRR